LNNRFVQVRIPKKIIEKLKSRFPELEGLSNTAIVKVALRKFLETMKEKQKKEES